MGGDATWAKGEGTKCDRYLGWGSRCSRFAVFGHPRKPKGMENKKLLQSICIIYSSHSRILPEHTEPRTRNVRELSNGFFYLHTGDAQKFFSLRLKPGLISDALFARTRNPNYFGELLIYSGFALAACASPYWYVPWSINCLVWAVLFVPNWAQKDRSLSRHEGFARYRKRSGLVVPWCFGDGWWGERENNV